MCRNATKTVRPALTLTGSAPTQLWTIGPGRFLQLVRELRNILSAEVLSGSIVVLVFEVLKQADVIITGR